METVNAASTILKDRNRKFKEELSPAAAGRENGQIMHRQV